MRIMMFQCSMFCKSGYKDFIPERNQRNSDNNGYELFTELMDLANRWVTRQQGVRFTNLQSLSVKLKKGLQHNGHFSVNSGH